MTGAPKPKLAEGDLQAMLQRRYLGGAQPGNGPAWAYVPQVRNAAGFDANRTCDGIAMALWPSRGLEIHGHEIKCSRSDWRTELANPAKAEAFTRLCDRWWLVVADKAIVAEGELPAGWGLMAPQGGGLKVHVQAQLLRPMVAPASAPPPNAALAPDAYAAWLVAIKEGGRALPPGFGRSFLAALLRSAAKTHLATPDEVRQQVDAAVAKARAADRDSAAYLRTELEKLRDRVRAFEQAAGVGIGYLHDDAAPRWQQQGHTPAQVGAALRQVLHGEAEVAAVQQRLRNMADGAERVAREARQAAGDV